MTNETKRGRAALDLALELATMHARVSGQVTSDDVVELLVDQLAAMVVGLALHRGRPLVEARAGVLAMLEASIGNMAADVAADAGAGVGVSGGNAAH